MSSNEPQYAGLPSQKVLDTIYNRDRDGDMIAVFCTAKIPIPTLNLFLEDFLSSSDKESHACHLLSTTDPTALAAIKRATRMPVPDAFASPFVGMTLAQVHDFFAEHVSSLKPFAGRVFIVLDERTLRDRAVLVSAADPEPDEAEGRATQRADFFVCRQLAEYHDLAVERLGEYEFDPERKLTNDEIEING